MERLFHSVSSFNNAGFALYSDNLIGFAADPFICLPICAAVILGGSGSRCSGSCAGSSAARCAGR